MRINTYWMIVAHNSKVDRHHKSLISGGIMLKKEYLITEISAAPDGGPYVLISLVDPRDLKSASQPRSSPHVVMGFTSMEDLMKDLQRAFSGLSRQMVGGAMTVIKLDMREYEESGLKVGDKIYVEITRTEKEGV